MHTRHLNELAGSIDPQSGIAVRAYEKPVDFEFQVERHLRAYVVQAESRPHWPQTPEAIERQERAIRLALATGHAWLFPEPPRQTTIEP